MSFSKSINFDDQASFSYDSDSVEFVAAQAQTKLMSYPNESLYIPFRNDFDELRGAIGAPTVSGGASISGEKLDLSGPTKDYLEYPIGSVGASLDNQFCVRMKVTPNFTGAPSGTQTFFAAESGGFPNLFEVDYRTDGNIGVLMRDSTGTNFANITRPWSPDSGTEYELEININTATGENRVFIDGVQLGVTDTATGDRTGGPSGSVFIGTDAFETTTSDFSIRDLQIFSAVQHTSDFSEEVPRGFIGNYATGSFPVVPVSTTAVQGISDVDFSGTSGIRFYIVDAGVSKYWDGAAWSASDGSTQVNTLADINTNLPSLDLSLGVVVNVVPVIVSDGLNQESISVMSYSYDFYGDADNPISKCVVFIQGADLLDGESVSDAVLTATVGKAFFHSGKLIFSECNQSVNLDANLYGELEIIETSTVGKKVSFSLSYTCSDGSTKTITLKPVAVPNQVSANLATISKVL